MFFLGVYVIGLSSILGSLNIIVTTIRMRAPGMGSTGAAKDSLEWLAVPTSGMAIIGLTCTLGLTIKCAWKG